MTAGDNRHRDVSAVFQQRRRKVHRLAVPYIVAIVVILLLQTFHVQRLAGVELKYFVFVYPDRVKSLSLVDPAGFYIPEEESIYNELLNGVNLFQITTPEEYSVFRRRIFHTMPKLPNFVKEFMIERAIRNREWYGKIMMELVDLGSVKQGLKTIEEASLNSICGEIKAPTKNFWGKHDTLLPYKTGEFLNNKIEGSQLYIFENTGHCPHLESPRQLAEKLDEFIKSI